VEPDALDASDAEHRESVVVLQAACGAGEPEKMARNMNAWELTVATLLQIGRGMTLVGLLLGGIFYVAVHYGRQPTRGFEAGRNDVRRATGRPLLAIGLAGAVVWIIAALR
jgi:hypothetical protein